MWQYLILGVCSSLCLHGAVGLVALIRFLPSLLSLLRYLIRLVLVCSFRLYRVVLTWAAPHTKRHLNLDLLTGWARLVVCGAISLTVTLFLLLLLQVNISMWIIVPALVHGFLVGLLWDDLSQPGELRMGVKLS